MSGADYKHCEVCGNKTFYDAEVDYEWSGEVKCLCRECSKTYCLVVVDKKADKKGK